MRTIIMMSAVLAVGYAAAINCTGEIAAISEQTENPPPLAGIDEPAFDPAIHTSTFYDDFDSYASIDGAPPRLSVDGEGDNDYRSIWGNSPNKPWGEYRIAVGEGRNGTNAVAVKYYRHPNYPTTIGYSPGTLVIDSSNPPDGGGNPDVALMTLWVKTSSTSGYVGKFLNRFEGGTNSCRLIFGVPADRAMPNEVIRVLYWDPNNSWAPYDPIHTAPSGVLNGDLIEDHCDFDDGQDEGSDVYIWPSNVGWDRWNGDVDLRDGQYHRLTIRLTKSPAGFSTGAPNNWTGGGRIEWWWDGHKAGEWLGNDPDRPEYGLVYLPEQGGPERLWNKMGIFSETKNSKISGLHEWFLDEWRFYR